MKWKIQIEKILTDEQVTECLIAIQGYAPKPIQESDVRMCVRKVKSCISAKDICVSKVDDAEPKLHETNTAVAKHEPFPVVLGAPITREEIIEALMEGYRALVTLVQLKSPDTVGFPDMEIVLNYIDKYGLPPKVKV